MPFDVISTVPLSGYAPSTALGIDTTTAQLYTSGLDQMWEPVGGGGANFPINTDITSMQAIEASGNAGDAIGINIVGSPGENILAIQVGNGSNLSSWQANGQIDCSGLATNGNIVGGNLLISGNCTIEELQNGTPGVPITIAPAGGGGDSSLLISGSPGAPTSGQDLLAFGPNYFTQTTVGGSGAASPPPTNPVLYVQIKAYKPDGTPVIVCFPCYATS